MLTDIKHYIRSREQVSLRDLCLRFDTTPATMRDMLNLWIRKGKVKRTTPDRGPTGPGASADDACGSCNGCAGPGLEAEFYRWCSAFQPRRAEIDGGPITFFRCASSGPA